MTPITSKEAEAEIGKAKPPRFINRVLTHAPLREAIKTWNTVPKSRIIILFYAARIWYFVWSGWMVIGVILREDIHSWLLGMVVAGIVTTFALLIAFGARPGLTFVGMLIPWLFILWVVSTSTWLVLWGVGTGLIAINFAASLFIPIWAMEITQNEVYITEDKTPHSEGFMLKSRPRPRLSTDLRAELLKAELPADLLDQFLKFGGPRFMESDLKEKLKPGSELLLRRLWDEMADPQRRESTTLHVAAVDQVWLLWDKSKKMSINVRLDQVITKGGSPVNLQLQFDFVFDPESIRSPEFRLSLPKWHSMEALEAVFKKAMEGSASKAVRLHFVTVPLESALTEGTIQKFREVLPKYLEWSKNAMGLTLKPDSIQCTPIIHETVQEAETRMMASRAQAQADLAQLQVLLDQVILGGVPPKLLAGLMLLGHNMENMSLTNRMDDMLNLPDADLNQQLRFFFRKYGDVTQDHVETLFYPKAPQPNISSSSIVEPPPVAIFTATPTSGVAPLLVKFANTSTGKVKEYAWDFGDGSTDTLMNPEHTYTRPGVYTVKLTIFGQGGEVDDVSATITVTEPGKSSGSSSLLANFIAAPINGNAPLIVSFSDMSTGKIANYAWDFGDGSTDITTGPMHTYIKPGTYEMSLTVTGQGGKDQASAIITVKETQILSALLANFTSNPINGFAPLTVTFSDTSTGNIISRIWDFGDGHRSASPTVAYTYSKPGRYKVTLTVAGQGGQDQASAIILVKNPPSRPSFNVRKPRR